MTLRLATRRSEQARAQSQYIADRLRALLGEPVELVLVDTAGDKDRVRPIAEIGGRGVFVKEVQSAVVDGRADLAVHSAKDLPSSWTADGLVLACVPERNDPRDALVGVAYDALRFGATIATGSVRRQAQLAHARPDLKFVGLRGNIPTRVARADADDVDAAVVAYTGAAWVGLANRIASVFEVDQMVPQVGQGALAIECRAGDEATLAAIRELEHPASRRAVDTERAFLARLGGGCDLPVGAHARIDADGISVVGLIASLDGTTVLKRTMRGTDPSIGETLAQALLDAGGQHLIDVSPAR